MCPHMIQTHEDGLDNKKEQRQFEKRYQLQSILSNTKRQFGR